MKLIFAILLPILMLQSQRVWSQSQPEVDNTDITLNHIAMYVFDLEKSTTFYRDVIKVKVIPEPFNDGRHAWFSVGGNSQLHLIQGAPERMEHDKNTHLCFSVKSVDDFIVNLDKYKIEYTNWPGDAKAPTIRVDGVKQVYFQDPDGYWLEINDDFPGRN